MPWEVTVKGGISREGNSLSWLQVSEVRQTINYRHRGTGLRWKETTLQGHWRAPMNTWHWPQIQYTVRGLPQSLITSSHFQEDAVIQFCLSSKKSSFRSLRLKSQGKMKTVGQKTPWQARAPSVNLPWLESRSRHLLVWGIPFVWYKWTYIQNRNTHIFREQT